MSVNVFALIYFSKYKFTIFLISSQTDEFTRVGARDAILSQLSFTIQLDLMSQSLNQISNQLSKLNGLFWVGGQWAGINFAIFMENYFGSKSAHYIPGKIKQPRTCPNLKNFKKLTTFPNSLGWECQLGGRGINCNTWQLPFAFPVHQLPLFPLPTIIPLLFALIISITTFTKK